MFSDEITPSTPSATTRRTFIKTAGGAVVTTTFALAILGTENQSGSRKPILGTGQYRYEANHQWVQLPRHIKWGDTHDVCVDTEGLIYVKHRSRAKTPMDAIVVFDHGGHFVRSFGKKFHGGGHGIDVRKEGNEEFLYLSCIQLGIVEKVTLAWEKFWQKGRPTEAGVYDDPKLRYSPTNVAFGPDGGFYIGDGYGSHYIHQYDRDSNWIRTWSGGGAEPGKMKTPHGLWLDDRPDRSDPALVVCDRANARLQYFTLDGEHLDFVNDVSFPADIDIQGDVMICPDLHARITRFDRDNKVITHLGYEENWTQRVLANRFEMRRMPDKWEAGRFIHPHDACFDRNGNIFVVEWVPTGRVSILRKVT